jgi:hypothetical protein
MKAQTKVEAWIFDVAGTPRHGWLEVGDEGGEARPADRGWNRVAVFPPDGTTGATRVVLWADQRDKYVARLDIGDLHRWIICERLPALLHALASLNALIAIGRR